MYKYIYTHTQHLMCVFDATAVVSAEPPRLLPLAEPMDSVQGDHAPLGGTQASAPLESC